MKIAKTGKRKIMDIKDIKIDPRNPKLHPKWQVEKLGTMIDKYGYDQIIVVDENNICRKGTGRLLSLLERGYDKVEVEVKEGLGSEDEKLAYAIGDNKIISQDWNNEVLAQNLPTIGKLGIDTGFNEKEIRARQIWATEGGCSTIRNAKVMKECKTLLKKKWGRNVVFNRDKPNQIVLGVGF